MGVPKFYRFISERYPLINTPLRLSSAPEIDNLYLDMNGIIHNCVRTTPGLDGPDSNRYSTSAPPTTKSHQQIFLDVFKYIDNLLSLITPRRVVYMAIDGVAPRAKMNQQRARRFRSAKERLDEHKRMMEENPMYAAAGVEPFDSNCITPGTHFMYKLTEALTYFVAKKLTEDIKWANIEVILSGAEAPGEGEHKIMSYIRAMRESGQLPANTRHCVYGLDADLIMLGLVTHEPHFFILREKVDFNYWKKKGGPRVATALDTTVFGEFELLSIGLLREYLALELGAEGNSELAYFDVERIADDFVFIVMLIGNDFLPNLPTLDITDGTLHVMLHLYRRVLPLLGGYLTDSGRIQGERLEYFFAKLGVLEEDVLRRRLEDESSGSGRRNRRGQRGRTFANVDLDQLFGLNCSSYSTPNRPLSAEELSKESSLCREKGMRISSLKSDYYMEKFGSEFAEGSGLERVTRAYVEGIAWTLKYYTEGCRQWRWFYPEHYAPLASDVRGVTQILTSFEKQNVTNKPFRPFEQLLSVLPPVSSWCLPAPYRLLMSSSTSPIRDQYPEDFRTDINGKRNDWEAVVLLPFVDEERLLEAIRSIPREALTREEILRNEFGPSYSYRRNVRSKDVMESPFGTQMPSFINQTKRRNLVLPSIAAGKPFSSTVLLGTKAAKSGKTFADLPTLQEVEHSSRLEAIGVNVFGTPSKSDSLVLEIGLSMNDDKRDTEESNSEQSKTSILEARNVEVGSSVWCGYPWRVSASVESISNHVITKSIFRGRQGRSDGTDRPVVEVRKTNKESFERDLNVVTSSLFQRHAVSISTPRQLVAVRPVGETIRHSSAKKNELWLYHEHFLKPRSSEQGNKTHLNWYTGQLVKGATVLYVGHGCYFGHKGSVVSRSASGLVRIQFDRSSAAAREPAFGYRVVSVCGTQERWMPLSRLAATTGMRVPLVDLFLGSLRVRLNSGKEEVDLGLGVKYIGRGLYVPGYARPDDRSHFLFSRKCADLLHNYAKAFPTLFEALDKMKAEEAKNGGRSRGHVIYEGREIFAHLEKPDEAVKAVSTWVSMQDVASLPLVSEKAHILTKDVVLELEKHCSIVLELQREFDKVSKKSGRYDVTKDVDLDALLSGREPLEGSLDGGTTPTAIHHAPVKADASDLRLGDRVVNRMGSGGVPFGLRGTVVGIHPPEPAEGSDGDDSEEQRRSQALVEVCFDEGFIGGGNLGNRCSAGRGKVVPATSLLIVRPDRANPFYVKNYAQVAARVALKQSAEKEGRGLEKSKAVADAAVKSYAAAVKKRISSFSTQPVAASSIAGDGKNGLMTFAEGRVPGNTNGMARGAPYARETDLGAKPDCLPLPSFLRPRSVPYADMKLNAEDTGSSTRGPARLHCKESGTDATNGDMFSNPTLIEGLLKKEMDKEDISDVPRGSTSTLPSDEVGAPSSRASQSDFGSPQNETNDEDEFAAFWRKLQTSSGKEQAS